MCVNVCGVVCVCVCVCVRACARACVCGGLLSGGMAMHVCIKLKGEVQATC